MQLYSHLALVAFFCVLGCNRVEQKADPAVSQVAVKENAAKAIGAEQEPKAPPAEQIPSKGKVEASAGSSNILVRTAEGIGNTYDEALKDAFRKAIWQVVGVVVDAETLMKNDQITSDQVLTYGNGTIKTFEELSNIKDQGLCRVRIKAAVEKGKVIENLKAQKVTITPIKGDDLYAELATSIERAKGAQALVKKALKDFPLNVMSAEVLGKPEILERAGARAKIKVRVNIKVAPQAYLRFVTGFSNTLEIVAKEKKTDIGLNVGRWGHLYAEGEQDIGTFCRTLSGKAGKDVGVLVNTHRTIGNTRTEWVYFKIDEAVRPELGRCCRECRIKLTLLSEGRELIAAHREAAIYWPDFGSAGIHRVRLSAIHERRRVFVVSPFFYILDADGFHHWDGWTTEMLFDLSLDEIKRVKEFKCELSYE